VARVPHVAAPLARRLPRGRTSTLAAALLPVLLLWLLSPAEPAGKLHTRHGFAIDAETWWEQEGILYYRRRGATQVIPRSDVVRIEGTPDTPRPAPPAAPPSAAPLPAPPPASAGPAAPPRFCLAGAPPVVTRADLPFLARMNQALPQVADDATREIIADRLATCGRLMHRALDGAPVDSGDLRAYCCP
jgi:hypothetical protein